MRIYSNKSTWNVSVDICVPSKSAPPGTENNVILFTAHTPRTEEPPPESVGLAVVDMVH